MVTLWVATLPSPISTLAAPGMLTVSALADKASMLALPLPAMVISNVPAASLEWMTDMFLTLCVLANCSSVDQGQIAPLRKTAGFRARRVQLPDRYLPDTLPGSLPVLMRQVAFLVSTR